MGKSYKKNIKDKNARKKVNIKKEIKAFDEKIVFETEEEFMTSFKIFLSSVEEEKVRKYLFAYIRYLLEKRKKETKELDHKGKGTSQKKIEKKKESIQRGNRILSYLNKEIEKQGKEKKGKPKKKENRKIEGIIKESKEKIEPLKNYDEDINAFISYAKENALSESYIQKVNNFMDLLCTLEQKEEISKARVEEELYVMIDILSHKIYETDKEDKKAREGYKRIKTKSEIVLEIYKEDSSKPKHDYYYDILEILLKSEQNYYGIEKLLNNIKEFVNAKKMVHTEKGTISIHILYTILDLYIKSYKLELRNQTKDFVPREYYQKLYYLFLKDPYLQTDKNVIERILDDFVESIDSANYLKNNKDQIIKEIETMKKGKEVKEEVTIRESVKDYLKYIEYQIIDATKSQRERMDASYLKEMRMYYEKIMGEFINPTKEEQKQIQRTLGISNRTKRNITMGCETISFRKDHSYTLGYCEDGSYSLRLNELDLVSITKNTPLEEYLSKALDKGENLLQKEKHLNLETGKTYPTITYEIRIEPNGNIGHLKIYPSTTEIEKKYDKYDKIEKEENLKKWVALYKSLTDDHKPNLDVEIIDNYFLSLFGSCLIQYAEERNLPLIVKGQSDFDKENYIQLHFELCEIYSKLKKDHFKQIFEILSANLDKEHFVNHDYQNGSYHMHLENDYVKYWNQEVIKEAIQKERMGEEIIEESNKVLEKANKGISYMGRKKPIDKKRKIVYYKN